MEPSPFLPPKPNPTKIATKWALIYVVTSIVLTYTFQLLNIDPESPVKYISLVPFTAFLVLAQVEYKTALNGSLSYGEAFSTAFRYALFAGLLLTVFTFIYLKYLSPDVLVKSMDAQREKMTERGLSDAQIDQALSIGSKYGAIFGAVAVAIFTPILGCIVGAITSAVVKKDHPPIDLLDQDPTV